MIKLGRVSIMLAAVVLPVTLAGCSQMTWEQKLDALRQAGERGADAHYVLLTSNKPPTAQTCHDNYRLFTDGTPDEFVGASSAEWMQLHEQYFVDSCVSGQPRRPVTRPTTPAPPPPPPASPGTPPPAQ